MLESTISSTDAPNGSTPADAPLFDALREHRRQLAQQQGVPPYVILHDRTLHAICAQRPADREQLAAVPGIGAQKLERYADGILRLVAEHPRAAETADSVDRDA